MPKREVETVPAFLALALIAQAGLASVHGIARSEKAILCGGRPATNCDSSTLVVRVENSTLSQAWIENGAARGVHDFWSTAAPGNSEQLRAHARPYLSRIGQMPMLVISSDAVDGWIRLRAPARDTISVHIWAMCRDDYGVEWSPGHVVPRL